MAKAKDILEALDAGKRVPLTDFLDAVAPAAEHEAARLAGHVKRFGTKAKNRKRAADLFKRSLSIDQVAKEMGVTPRTVRRWFQQS